MLGAALVGLADGFPGETVGPTEVVALVVGAPVAGWALGAPADTVGPIVVRQRGV